MTPPTGEPVPGPTDAQPQLDERLVADIRRSYEQATRDLTYQGAFPRARRPVSVVAAPLLATAALVVAVGWVAVSSHEDGLPPTESPAAVPPSRPSGGAGGADGVVTEQITLAGTTYTYRHGRDEPSLGQECPAGARLEGDAAARPCFVELVVVRVPDGVTGVEFDGRHAGVRTDPVTGVTALYVHLPDGRVAKVLSSGPSPEQMIDIARTVERDNPRPAGGVPRA